MFVGDEPDVARLHAHCCCSDGRFQGIDVPELMPDGIHESADDMLLVVVPFVGFGFGVWRFLAGQRA